MTFSRKHVVSNFIYSINNTSLSRVTSYKYLGIQFTPNLSWSSHISAVCNKASRTLGFIRRNLRNSPSSVRKLAYFTFVRPQLEFISPIWSPHQKYLIDMLESIQSRAARYIFSNYSPLASVSQLKYLNDIQILEIRRSISLLCLFHKYVHTRPSLLPLASPFRSSQRLHNQLSFNRIYGKTLSFNSSALPRAIKLWNDLPDNIISFIDPGEFKKHLCIHLLP